jgi:hypothetical protein
MREDGTPRRDWPRLRRIVRPRPAADLAVFRVLVVIAWLSMVRPGLAAHFAMYPRELCFPPFAWQKVIDSIHVSAIQVWIAYAIFVLGAIGTLIGWRTRLSLIVMTLAGGLVLSIPQFFGKVNHDNDLIWFALLLIASPCGDALSMDAKRRGVVREASVAYALPLVFAIVLLGIAYLFPGIAKARATGAAWGLDGHLRSILHTKWIEFGGWTPWPRIDRWPAACAALSMGTLVFELGFLPLSMFRRTRPALLLLGLGFHLGTMHFMRIPLWHMAMGYVLLAPDGWLGPARRWAAREPLNSAMSDAVSGEVFGADDPAKRSRGVMATLVVGGALVAGNIYDGVRVRDDWPLGAYPTFAWRAGDRQPTLRMHATMADGSERIVSETFLAGFSTPERARALAIVIRSNDPRREARLLAYWNVLTRFDPALAGARSVAFNTAIVSTDPEEHGRVLEARTIFRHEFASIGTDADGTQGHGHE